MPSISSSDNPSSRSATAPTPIGRGEIANLSRRLLPIVFGAAVAAGFCAWAIPMLWTADLTGDSRLVALAGFAVLLLEVFAFHGGVFLLALAILALAVQARRSAALLALLACIHAGPGLASMLEPRETAPVHDTGPTLTVLSHNLLFSSASLDVLARAVESERPDVIMLQEVVASRAHEITDRFGEDFPYRIRPESHRWGAMLLSRHPFCETPDPVGGHEYWPIDLPAGVIEFMGTRVTLASVHLPAPNEVPLLVAGPQMTSGLVRWMEDNTDSDDAGQPVILAGDFNAPLWTSRMSPLRDIGLSTAHDSAGLGRGATWPARTPLRFAPGIRLDQVVFRGGIDCVESRVLAPTGSDHRPVLARFVVRPSVRADAGRIEP